MISLLKSKPIATPAQSRSFNSLNGSDAETLAASQLLSACRGEICWGSREEDNSKIDLIISCEHPWYPGERMLVLTQVKSGGAYGELKNMGFKLKSSAIKAAKRTSHSICIVWVSRENNLAYWAYVHPNTQISPREYGLHHHVTPATIFDLARCMSKNSSNAIGGRGVIIRRREGNITKRRKTVNEVYKKYGELFSPAIGKIELTRFGWRHMFRAGRSASYKQSSMELIPYLSRIVSQSPSAHAITDTKQWESKGYIYRATEHLLKYTEVLYSEKEYQERQPTNVVIKVIEEIRYPRNWRENAMLSQSIDRRVVLKSAYYKVGRRG